MTSFRFTRQNRNPRVVILLICIYAVLIGLIIFLNAAWWLMALLALATLPAVCSTWMVGGHRVDPRIQSGSHFLM